MVVANLLGCYRAGHFVVTIGAVLLFHKGPDKDRSSLSAIWCIPIMNDAYANNNDATTPNSTATTSDPTTSTTSMQELTTLDEDAMRAVVAESVFYNFMKMFAKN
ncbi:unnamed protein product [Larinioides sclopetarius]|uniref:Uncharacterized protein n=1 Tax=Larinioides sclopetarius TaxID=280406 RepID=A0AAV2AHK6_9ARAC